MFRKIPVLILLIISFSVSALEIDFAPVKSEDVSILVYDPENGENVYSLNAEKPFSYASNLKLLTSAAALHYLGGGFRFMTLFSFDVSTGTLYIKAAGDPEMVIEKLWVMANDFKRRGIKDIKKVVVDDYIYGQKGFYRAKSGDKGDNAYLAYISPLGLNYNAVEIFVKAVEPDKPVEVTLSTPGPHFVINNTAKGIKGGGNGLIVGAMAKNGQTEIVVKGTLGAARTKPVIVYKRVGNPLNHYIQTLLHLMGEKDGIPVLREKIPTSLFSKKGNINYTHKSSPLRDILRVMNLYSSNYMADALQFFMGAVFKGDSLKGVEVLKEFAKMSVGEDIDIINGSGLGNSSNKLSASFYIKLLKKVFSDYYGSVDLFSSLPVMGEDGTLKKASTGNSSTGMIRAKTGSLTGVAALSGIMKAKSGKLYLFAFAVNNYPSKQFKPMWNFRDRVLHQIWEQY